MTSPRVPTPIKRLHHPSRWSEWSEKDKAKIRNARPMSAHASTDRGQRAQPKLLDVLGLSPLPSGAENLLNMGGHAHFTARSAAYLPTHLPACAPENLEHCSDDCYWRWLVHTLLDEVGALRQSLEDAQREFQQHAAQRQKLERGINYRDFVLDEMLSMTEDMEKLRYEVPQLRQDHEKQLDKVEHLDRRYQSLIAKQQELQAAIQRSEDHQKASERSIQRVEQEAEEGQKRETAKSEMIKLTRDEMQQEEEKLQEVKAENEELREELQMIEQSKKAKRAGKRRQSR